MVTRRISAFDPAVITIASIHSGTTFNVIPEIATLEGTVRAVSDESRQEAIAGVHRVAERIAAAHMCAAEVTPAQNGYPVTVNDPGKAATALAVRIADRGGVRPLPEQPAAPDLDAKLAGLQTPRGWGLFLIKDLVDDVHDHSSGTEHTIDLILFREGDEHGAATP